MRILLTGAAGFLGWHTRLRLHAQGEHTVIPVTRDNWSNLPQLVSEADAVIHIAGVNRAEDPQQVTQDNVRLARDLASALEGRPGLRVVYANSTQAGNGSPYGTGKAEAAHVLARAGTSTGCAVVDVRLPNAFGEHGRPRYNSFVATFIDAAVRGEEPLLQDNQVPLLHAQDAAQALIDGLVSPSERLDPLTESRRVGEVWDLLSEFANTYRQGVFPDLSTKFRVDLFNSYRAALFPEHYPIMLVPHSDSRGTFVETVRAHGGEGQSSISTTVPGITRGEHYHLRKIERFAVVQGEATIALRRKFTSDIVEFPVRGDAPSAIDMPIGWVHNITNTGTGTLITQFWSHEHYDSRAPDTYPAAVYTGTATEEVFA